MSFIILPLRGRLHRELRFGKKKTVFREKIQKWMIENIGIQGVDWHIHIDPQYYIDHEKRVEKYKNTPDSMKIYKYPPTYVLKCEESKALLFKLTWWK